MIVPIVSVKAVYYIDFCRCLECLTAFECDLLRKKRFSVGAMDSIIGSFDAGVMYGVVIYYLYMGDVC